jgi:anthranilate 1,2-dioxygenase small subunit
VSEAAQADDVLAEYGARLDEDRLEAWLDLFDEDCDYKIVSRENLRRELPLALIWCENKHMLRDRVVSLRQANIYNIHTDRHVIGRSRVIERSAGILTVEASYAHFQTDQEGVSRLFSVGVYRDRLLLRDGGLPLIRQKLVIADTAAIPSLLSTPI